MSQLKSFSLHTVVGFSIWADVSLKCWIAICFTFEIFSDLFSWHVLCHYLIKLISCASHTANTDGLRQGREPDFVLRNGVMRRCDPSPTGFIEGFGVILAI